MTEQDRTRFAATIAMLASVFGREVDEPLIDSYWMALGDLSLEDFEAAAKKLVGSAPHFPKPVEFKDLIQDSDADRAEQAWLEVVKLSRNCQAAKHSDPKAEGVVKGMGGWIRLGAMSEREFHAFAKRDFIDAYRGSQAAGARRELIDTADQGHLTPDAQELIRALAEKKKLK